MSKNPDSDAAPDSKCLGRLWWLGLVSSLVYLAVAWLSARFDFDVPARERPILAVLALFGMAIACYFVAIRFALRAPQGRRLLLAITVPAIMFRAVMLPSVPIQEIDIYRYLWDGMVTAHGISPFRYSPQQVLDARADRPLPGDLSELVRLRDASPVTATIVSRIHYGHLPTVYPLVSQAVFAAATLVTPDDASVWLRMTIVKTFFVLYDLGTLLLIFYLLRRTGLHVGWSLAYAWCPLVVKEIAGSGHMDSVAVFLTTLAMAITVGVLFSKSERRIGRSVILATTLAGAVLALAVGAKMYPLVLAPLFGISVWRRLGFLSVAASGVVFTLLTVALMWPMLPSEPQQNTPPLPDSTATVLALPPLPTVPSAEVSQDPSAGLATFFRSWEMNDFLFMLVVENLQVQADTPPHQVPWFDVVPDRWTEPLLQPLAGWLAVDRDSAAFLLTRALTGALFLGIALVLAWRARATDDARSWLRAAFLTLAWFWLLLPTQNPWYWIWVLPLLPFARGRAWLAVSAVVFVYYLRFWLTAHWEEQPVPGTRYHGDYFFHFVVTWFEYVPVFAWLALESMRPDTKRTPAPGS